MLVLLGLCLGVIWQKGRETPLENMAERGKRPYGAVDVEALLCAGEYGVFQPPEDGAAYIIVQWASEADIDLYVYSEEGRAASGSRCPTTTRAGALRGGTMLGKAMSWCIWRSTPAVDTPFF